MKNLQAKIKRIEDETKRIALIDVLVDTIENGHENIGGFASFYNHSTLVTHGAVKIDDSIIIKMLLEQKTTIQLEIKEDVTFITAIELLATPK